MAALWELVDDGAGFDVTLDALISGGLRELPALRARQHRRGRDQGRAPRAGPRRVPGRRRDGRSSRAPAPPPGSSARSSTSPRMSIVLDEPTARTTAAVVRRGRRPVPHLPARRGARARGAGRAGRGAGLRARVPARRPAGDRHRARRRGAERAGPVARAAGLDAAPARAAARRRRSCRRSRRRPSSPSCPPRRWPRRRPLETDHDGLTVTGAWEPPPAAPPGIPGQQPAPDVTVPVARLVISNGEIVDVDRAIVIGRAPEARRFNDTEQPRLVTVPSPHLEISSTHVEVRPGSGADHGTRRGHRPGLDQRHRARPARSRPRGPRARRGRAADPRCADRPRRRRDHPGHQPLTEHDRRRRRRRRDRGADHRAPGGRPGPAVLRLRPRPAARLGAVRRGRVGGVRLPDRAGPAVGRRRRRSPARCCWSGLLTGLAVGLWGITPGKALVGLRVLSAEDARPIGVGRGAAAHR